MKIKDLIEKYGEYTIPDELIEKLEPPKPKTVWDLEIGDKYVLLFGTGEVAKRQLSDKTVDYCYLEAGNVFLTQEDAERDVKRRKVETLLLKHGGRRWFDEHNYNYHIGLDDCEEHLKVYILVTPTQGTIYFDTKEQVEKAISIIGEQEIKETLFEVR